jgi:hypothetical protein
VPALLCLIRSSILIVLMSRCGYPCSCKPEKNKLQRADIKLFFFFWAGKGSLTACQSS